MLLVGQLCEGAAVLCDLGIGYVHVDASVGFSVETSCTWPICCVVVGWPGDPGKVVALGMGEEYR